MLHVRVHVYNYVCTCYIIVCVSLSMRAHQVLLINFPSLGSMSAGENFKFIFREAKINDAILFFDECEAIFETREKGSHDVNMLLTEVERYVYMQCAVSNKTVSTQELASLH